LSSAPVDHREAPETTNAEKAAMKYSTGHLQRKRFAIRLRRKLLRLLAHSAMELNPEKAVALLVWKYISTRVALVRDAPRGH
jgi:hypothetical protein